MKNYLRLPCFVLFAVIFYSCNQGNKAPYSSPPEPWPESFGNHRALLAISDASEALTLDLLWRRHDRQPENKRFIIVEAETGDTVPNIYRYQVNNERCRLIFGPVRNAGTYYFYYLPYEVQEAWGGYGKDYLKPEKEPSAQWIDKNHLDDLTNFDNFPQAKVKGFESRTSFDSFYPMEIIPLASEKESFLSKYDQDFLVFPEDRAFPIRMRDEIPLKWVQKGPSHKFRGEACKNEYYAFQIGVYASKKELENIKVEFSALENGRDRIPSSDLTCFNTGGINPYGEPFEIRVDVSKGTVQPLWIGIDIPENISAGTYRGLITVKPENTVSQSVEVNLKITNKVLVDRGDSETWRHSRLRWLNSTLGIDNNPTKPFSPIVGKGDFTFDLTGKTIVYDPALMPGSIKNKGNEILARPVSFVVETDSGIEHFSPAGDIILQKNSPGIIAAEWKSKSKNFVLEGEGSVESDGYLSYKINIKAINNIRIKDVRLEIPFEPDIARYMKGMGLPGTFVPQSHNSSWKGPHDSFWIGNVDAGLWCELRGGEYHGPLLNLYRPEPPVSWDNYGKGGFRISRTANETKAIIYSGSREIEGGESIGFEWAMLVTPVKDINYQSQFVDRYFQKYPDPMPSDEDLASGVKIINLHHANNYNSYINYPFIELDSLRWFVNRFQDKGLKVKIYYTIRELSNHATELWALRSLGEEILGGGSGGGYPWLREHLIDGYRPQWYQHYPDKSPDASIVNAPGDSRWYNYYIEGLAWLVRNVNIDGLYLDDVTYDRRIVKRIRKVLDNEKPGCLIDLHSNTGFSRGAANQYAEFFPYMDKIWFGESFRYDEMPPENWLVEVSGIPFGLMGDMLQEGGNQWLGMVFGMTSRLGWITEGIYCDPKPVWKIWDEFGIEDSEMVGYWERGCPVKTNHPDVFATVYRKEGESLISVGNWANDPVSFSFIYDWEGLGINPEKAVLVAPEIEGFQPGSHFSIDSSIMVEAKKGWLFYLQETN